MIPASYDMSDIFTPDGIRQLTRGQLLVFDYEGKRVEYRITYVNKKSRKVRAVQTRTYTPEEFGAELAKRRKP